MARINIAINYQTSSSKYSNSTTRPLTSRTTKLAEYTEAGDKRQSNRENKKKQAELQANNKSRSVLGGGSTD